MFHCENNVANIGYKCTECLILYLAPEIVVQFGERDAEWEGCRGRQCALCVQFWNGVEMLWRLKKGKTLSGNVGQGHFSDASRVSIWA